MCYFVAVGTATTVAGMSSVFEEQTELDLGATAVCSRVASIFPLGDVVRLVTFRGCSCDLLAPAYNRRKEDPGRRLVAAFQQAIVRLTGRHGTVRLLVHRHAGRPSSRCSQPHPRARFALSLGEFLSSAPWFVEDVLIEVHSSEARLQTPAS